MKRLVDRGLQETAPLWPSVRAAFSWVHKAAQILDNPAEATGGEVRKRLASLLGAMSRHRRQAGELEEAVAHFAKVSRSYWPGLFHCYDDSDLSRTNNALEQQFGSYRWHERRITGRNTASPAMVQRGQVRIVRGYHDVARSGRQHGQCFAQRRVDGEGEDLAGKGP